MSRLSTLWARVQDFLYPMLEEDLGALTDKQKQFIAVCELAALDQQMGAYLGHRRGRKKKSRIDFAKAFIAKAVYDLGTTKLLIEYLGSCPSLRPLLSELTRSGTPLSEITRPRPLLSELTRSLPRLSELTRTRPPLSEINRPRPLLPELTRPRPLYLN